MYKIPLRFLLLTMPIFILSPANLHAALDEEKIVKQQEIDLKKQNDFFKRELEDNQAKPSKSKISQPVLMQDDEEISDELVTPCFKIKSIILEKATIITKKISDEIFSDLIGKCATKNKLSNINRRISNFYISKGYSTTTSFILPRDISKGDISVEVMEGKIEEIKFSNEANHKIFNKSSIYTAFPDQTSGDIFNIHKIEQGLNQFNRLQSNNIITEIIPGSKAGYSKIILKDSSDIRSIRGSLGLDNSGLKSTGESKRKFSFEQDNLLGLNDYLLFSYSKDNEAHDTKKMSENSYISIDLPYGYWNLSSSYSDSKYLSSIYSGSNSYESRGGTKTKSFKLQRAIYNDEINNLSANLKLDLKNTESFFEDSKVETGSRKLTIIGFSFSHTINSRLGSFSYSPSFFRGLDILDAKKDDADITGLVSRAQFRKFSFDASYAKRFSQFGETFLWKTSLNSQYSPDHLFSSEQISVGDLYSVRGFRNESLTGDSGGYIRNELSMSMPSEVSNFANKILAKKLSAIQFTTGYDTGFTRQRYGKETDYGTGKGYISGWSGGVKYNDTRSSFELSYSKAINRPSFLEREGGIIYGNLNISL